MSNGSNNIPPPPAPWNDDHWDLMNHLMSRALPFGATPNARGAQDAPWWPFQERAVTQPSGHLARIPVPFPTHSPVRVLVLGNDMTMNPQARWSIPESPPRFTVPLQEESILSPDEQKKALKNLRKEIYNPTPKRIIQRMNLYYRDNNNNAGEKKKKDIDEDDKRCAICLDDFEPKQVVMLTPCDHMFHEECIVPWAKSHGQCPVCRSAICEPRSRQSATVQR